MKLKNIIAFVALVTTFSACDDLFEGNDPGERILIFQLPDYDAET